MSLFGGEPTVMATPLMPPIREALGRSSSINGLRGTYDGMECSCGCKRSRLNRTSRSEERSRRGGLRGDKDCLWVAAGLTGSTG